MSTTLNAKKVEFLIIDKLEIIVRSFSHSSGSCSCSTIGTEGLLRLTCPSGNGSLSNLQPQHSILVHREDNIYPNTLLRITVTNIVIMKGSIFYYYLRFSVVSLSSKSSISPSKTSPTSLVEAT